MPAANQWFKDDTMIATGQQQSVPFAREQAAG
jgi:hypothetical protein